MLWCATALEAAKGADVLVALTEWNEFRALDLNEVRQVMRGNVLVDLRNIYQAELAEAAGLAHHGIGRPALRATIRGKGRTSGPMARRQISGHNRNSASPPLGKPARRWSGTVQRALVFRSGTRRSVCTRGKMRLRLYARENGRNQLTWLLLRVIAELAPCTPASLIAFVSGHSPPSGCGHPNSSTRRLVFHTLLALEIHDLVQTNQDQISITDKGRRYLDQWRAQGLPPPAPHSVYLRTRAVLLRARCESRRVYQVWLVAARVIMPRVLRMWLDVLHRSAAALQKWQLNVSPMIALRTKTLVGAMTRLFLVQARTALHSLRQRAVTLQLTYTMAARLAQNAKLAACDRRAVIVAVVVLALLVTQGVAFLSDKPAERVGGPLLDGPNHAGSTVETTGPELVALAEPAGAIATNDIDETPPETAFPEPRGIEQQDGATPVIIAQPDPIVVSIRSKLADPALQKRVPAKDLAALQSFYAELSLPHWVAGTGLSPMAQHVINEIRAADDWGLAVEAFDLPSTSELPTPEEQATDEIKLSVAVLKYARLARGGRISLTALRKANPPKAQS